MYFITTKSMLKKNPYVVAGRTIGLVLFFGWLVIVLWLGINPFAKTVSLLELFCFFICPLLYGAGMFLSLKKVFWGGVITLIIACLFYILLFIEEGFGSELIFILALIPGFLLLFAERVWNAQMKNKN